MLEKKNHDRSTKKLAWLESEFIAEQGKIKKIKNKITKKKRWVLGVRTGYKGGYRNTDEMCRMQSDPKLNQG